jgi:hypothetical protein
MKKIMATANPPLRFLTLNGYTEFQRKRSLKTGKMVKAIVSSHPIPIPNRPDDFR